MSSESASFRLLPSVDKILQHEVLAGPLGNLGHDVVKRRVKAMIEELRSAVKAGGVDVIAKLESPEFSADFCREVLASLEQQFNSTLVSLFNLTGTVVHTNLGRARLPDEAIAAMTIAASQATNLEFDLKTGKRGDRDSHLEACLCKLTGAEAATVVNNNAAAVMLVLNSLAFQKEVLISRGELVEIGGAFRIPDVMKSASCILREVGTTNRTHARDFSEAINEKTGLLMKVHTSNYEIKGFTKSIAEADLSALSSKTGVPFVSDLGSGTLVDLRQYGLPYEPTVQDTLNSGADIVTFSGDKLLGGPQAGIIVGKKELIDRIKRNPFKRALRIDKVTLSALVEVVNLYNDPRRLKKRLPILADLTRSLTDIEALAVRLLPEVSAVLGKRANVSVQECRSQIGSGALPLDLLESRAICIVPIAPKGERDAALTALSDQFRKLPKPVVGRLHDGALYFDLRCLYAEKEFTDQLRQLASN